MSAMPDDVSPRAFLRVMSEHVPDAGTEGRPMLRPTRDTVADDMRCTWPGCGDALAGSGAGRGWVLVRIVGSGDPPRRYHSGLCASRGIAHVELGNHRTDPAPVVAVPTPASAEAPSSKVVKRWAVEQGLIPEVVRGRCPQNLIDAYVAAH